ncbi:uncharacterized protein LOC129917540 [Episyrphus balteatus]|uniref:uncharacterized protein LOC129917540 n=1 Tax=Episyrphus balteatus TaxID=286459 RepID=UPI00248592AA|nr:uncharacterized protein LOC129917540 [Episyrphus balteatus]
MKGFFEHIKYKYDIDTCKSLKHYCKQQKRLAKHKEKLKFLLSCKDYEIIPTHLANISFNISDLFTTDTIKQQFNKIQHTFLIKIVKLEIKQTILTIKFTENNIFHTNIEMRTTLNEIEYNTFTSKQKQIYNHTIEQSQLTQTTKFNKLKEQHAIKLGLIYNESWLKNKTSVEFPIESKWLLSLGKKFALPISRENFSPIHIIAEIEQYIQTIEDNKQKEIARSKVSNKIINFKRNIKNTKREKFILKTYTTTKNIINKHKDDIIVTNLDKGNKTVVMYREDYNTKMNQLLEDKNTYKTLRIDPTNKLQKKITK